MPNINNIKKEGIFNFHKNINIKDENSNNNKLAMNSNNKISININIINEKIVINNHLKITHKNIKRCNYNKIDLNNKLKNVVINGRKERSYNCLTSVPKKKKRVRPVYKIPPFLKQSVKEGKSLDFIHKYYDENFIMEDDVEKEVSNSENESDSESYNKYQIIKKSKSRPIFEPIKIEKVQKIVKITSNEHKEQNNMNKKQNENSP